MPPRSQRQRAILDRGVIDVEKLDGLTNEKLDELVKRARRQLSSRQGVKVGLGTTCPLGESVAVVSCCGVCLKEPEQRETDGDREAVSMVRPVYRRIAKKNEKQGEGFYHVLICNDRAVDAATVANTYRKARQCENLL